MSPLKTHMLSVRKPWPSPSVFRKCRFLGWQHTVYANRGRRYYKDCYIARHVDFIFGNASAVFDHCEIHSLGAGYLTAQSRLTAEGPSGYVFYHCDLTDENTGKGVFLGRHWRPYSRVVYIDCRSVATSVPKAGTTGAVPTTRRQPGTENITLRVLAPIPPSVRLGPIT